MDRMAELSSPAAEMTSIWKKEKDCYIRDEEAEIFRGEKTAFSRFLSTA